MPPSLAPAPFYGDNELTLDSIRRIRFSRLFDSESNTKSPEEKKHPSKSPAARSLFKGVKLFSNVSHGIKKAKLKKKKPLKEIKISPIAKIKSGLTVREKMREKYDFSRTPYALPVKKPRVTLNEETLKNRKFFKTSIETSIQKTPEVKEKVAVEEFADMNDVEEESFTEIKKGVSDLLHQIDWMNDDDFMKPQITRQVAAESLYPVSTPNKSYITLGNLSPSIRNNQNHNSENSPILEVHPTTPSTPTVFNSNIENDQPKKFYPLFTPSPARKNVLSDVTNQNKKVRNILNKAAAPSDQYQIDAGQRVIGPTECADCGMVFDIGDPYDIEHHEIYHNNRKAIKYKSMKSENVVGFCGIDRIILIKHSEEKKRKKVLEILKVTEEEIGQGYAFQSSFLAFLYVRNDTVLGCLIAEPNVSASHVIHSDGIVLLSEEKKKAKCGINRIWVKSEFRGQKIATELMNCLRKNFVFGEILELDDIAFSPTTPEGDAFAIKYCGRRDYLTYEGTYFK